MGDVFICDAVRTPIGRYAGALSKVRADDLAAVPIKALMARNPGDYPPERIVRFLSAVLREITRG